MPGFEYIYSQRGRPLIIVDNYLFRKNRGSYWRCIRCTKNRCKCRLILRAGQAPEVVERHSHGPETEKINFGRKVKCSMSTNSIMVQGDNENNVGDTFKTSSGPLEAVQLYLRHPHFDVESFDEMVRHEELSRSNSRDRRTS